MTMSNRELAIKWWNGKTTEEKIELEKKVKYPRDNYKSLTGREIEDIWRNELDVR